MRELDNVTCPESKVTPAMSRDLGLDMPVTAIFIDEVQQVPLEDRTPVKVEDKKLTAGEYVGELLTWLAKKGPAARIVLALATQRPDSKEEPALHGLCVLRSLGSARDAARPGRRGGRTRDAVPAGGTGSNRAITQAGASDDHLSRGLHRSSVVAAFAGLRWAA
jgi:hypothetical protein